MTGIEVSCLLLSLGAVATALLSAKRATARLGWMAQHRALQDEVRKIREHLGSVESRMATDWLGLRRSPEVRVAELLRQQRMARVILVRTSQSLDSRLVFHVRAQTKRIDEAARSLFRLEDDVLLIETHEGHDEAMLQAQRIRSTTPILGLVVAEILAPSPAGWALDQALAQLLRLPPQSHLFLLIKP